MKLTDDQIKKMLNAPIPGGSTAQDWFLPHECDRAKGNIYDVVRRMFAEVIVPENKIKKSPSPGM